MTKVNIRSFTALAGNAAQVIAQVYDNAGQELDPVEVRSAIQDATNGKMVAVANSFQVIASSSQYHTVLSGVVELAREAIPFTAEHKGFHSVSANMFMDENESIWALRESGSGDGILVRTNNIDTPEEISKLLSHCSSVGPSSELGMLRSCSSAVNDQAHTIDAGDMVLAYVPNEADLVFGIAVAHNFDESGNDLQEIVLMRPSGDYEAIANNLVAITVDKSSFDLPEVDMDSVSGNSNGDRLLDYYGKLYANHPEFFEAIEQRIRAHTFC